MVNGGELNVVCRLLRRGLWKMQLDDDEIEDDAGSLTVDIGDAKGMKCWIYF